MPYVKIPREILQKREAHVADCLACLTLQSPALHKAYLERARQMPVFIELYGLGQACAWLLEECVARGQHPAALRLFDDLQMWLCRGHQSAPYHGRPRLMEAIGQSEQHDYLAAQREAVQWLNDLHRQSLAPGEPGEPGAAGRGDRTQSVPG